MKKGFRRSFYIFLCTLLIICSFPVATSADTGPKPSVRISFENIGDELCYGTLLSEKESTGPNSVWDGDEEHIYNDVDIDIWKSFAEYEDKDGFYYLQATWEVSQTHEIAWTYYPPQKFKILLYFPESKTFAVSGIYERYAFDTYYTVDMSGFEIGSVEYDDTRSTDGRIDAYRSYQWQQELLSLATRILITIAVEMIVALIFGFKCKKALIFLIVINTVTQIILNILLNLINFSSGQAAFVFWYVLLEIGVFIIEAVMYCTAKSRISEKNRPNWFYVLYALVANVVSFVSGLAVAEILPGIF